MPRERNEFLLAYNPDRQRELCQDGDDCIFGDYPTLSQLKVYGNKTPSVWLMPHLLNLSEFCGCKDKLTGRVVEELADIIAGEWFYLKVSELMLFFYKFKAGYYGKFYGAVDPLVITTSLREFVAERNDAISRKDAEKALDRLREHQDGAITYEEYKLIKEGSK